MSEAQTEAPAAPAPPPTIFDAPAAPPPAAPTEAPPAPEWLATLPEDLRAKPSLAKFQEPAALAKSYVELEGLVGRKGAIPPKDGDPPEVAAAFRAALGVPEAPEGYDLKLGEGIPAEVWNDGTAAVLRGWAHEAGLTPKQAQVIAERYAGMLATHAQAAHEETQAALRQEWGPAYDRKVAAGNAALRQFFDEAGITALKASGALNDPAVVRGLVQAGEAIGDHDGTVGMGAGGGAMTPNDATAALATIRANPAYWNRDHPEHKLLVERATALEFVRTGEKRVA